MSTEQIRQRAQELQRQLGMRAKPTLAVPARSLKDTPFNLASLDEWTTTWAESEAAVVAVTGKRFSSWTSEWVLNPLQIRGQIAMGTPYCVSGPPPLIAAAMQAYAARPKRLEGQEFCDKAASVIDAWLLRIRDSLMQGGKPMYPNFAMYHQHVVPPMPNMPMKLREFTFGLTEAQLVPQQLALELHEKATTKQWSAHFGEHQSDLGTLVCESIAKRLCNMMQLVLDIAMVTNVMGTGTVPGCMPPANVPGPVIGFTLPKPDFLVGVPGAVGAALAST